MPQNSSPPLRLGTRGSTLALVQADIVKTALAGIGIGCEILAVKTSGDKMQTGPLADAGGKGLFTKELEEALLAGTIDLAVHSMKDVPAFLPGGLALAACLPREDPRDAFLSNVAGTLADLPAGARVGTSSVRRKALLARSRPDLQCVLLRGNIETRLAKLDSGQMEAAILAFAGLRRLGLASRATSLFEPGDWLNAPAQGAIGIEVRADDSTVRQTIRRLDDEATAIAIACERAFLAALDGSCRTPIGALAQWNGCRLTFRGEVLAPDGSDNATARFDDEPSGDIRAGAAQLGRQAGLSLRPRAAGWLGF